ncbi:MAG: hypothetical protein IT166_22840 [Bryobacterales bacterium]|nr:hypothetical protein [Bryobacterales bacterium]
MDAEQHPIDYHARGSYATNAPGQPFFVFPPVVPAIRIVSVNGAPLPSQPTADANTPDLTLGTTASLSIVVEATHVPSGTEAKVMISPQMGWGAAIDARITLTGSAGQPKRGTATVSLPNAAGSVGIISAVIPAVTPEP